MDPRPTDIRHEEANAAPATALDPCAQMRRALDEDELVLFCQPIRALNAPHGFPIAEVLVRMRQEEKALLPPGDFLPAFEHYQMMPQLDRWVVRHVAKWLARNPKVPRLSINVSGQTLEDADFPRFFAARRSMARLAGGAVIFEIDERDVLAAPDAAARFAIAIKAVGGGLLIDSFGHRDSLSFAPLKALGLDFIKVDGAITRRLNEGEPAMSKMKAIVRAAGLIGAGVIAEFIEDPDLLVLLKALDVGYAQGFGVYQPQPIEALLGT